MEVFCVCFCNQDYVCVSQRDSDNEQNETECDGAASTTFFAGWRPTKLGGRVMYSHHIWAPGDQKMLLAQSYLPLGKRRAIQRWAHDLWLGGYSKIGYPGIIIVEGPEECCQE